MTLKKMLSIFIILIAIGATAYFVFTKDRQSSVPCKGSWQGGNCNKITAHWKTYRNEQYGLELQYPPEWAPLEGTAVTYDQSALPTVLRICFGPEDQNKNYCGVELYVVRENQFPENNNSDTFVGFPRRLTKAEFGHGNENGTRIETYVPQRPGRIMRNEFLKNNGLVYLLVSYNSDEFQKLQMMTDSFTFLKQSPHDWKTYRNEKYGFEIKYPPTLEPLEGRVLSYQPPKHPQLLNVCFAPVIRREFSCEVELYIATAPSQNPAYLDDIAFLGRDAEFCPVDVTIAVRFDNINGLEADTCGKDDSRENALARKDGYLYLLSIESAGYASGREETFRSMINSFRFIAF